MIIFLLILIFLRPFISSLAYPYANAVYSLIFLGLLSLWINEKKVCLQELKTVKYPLILFICTLLISSIFSTNRFNSFSAIFQYAIGILIFLICSSSTIRNRILIIRVIFFTGVIISVLAIHQYFFGFTELANLAKQEGINSSFLKDYINSRRTFFPFVTPNILAGYLAMIMPLAFIYKRRIWLLLPITAALFSTKSIGGFISITVVTIIYLLLSKKTNNKKFIFALSVLIIAITVVIFLRSTTQRLHQQPLFSTAMRLDYLGETIKVIAHAPFKGIGPGNFTLPVSRYAHNSYLQLWAECGIIGLIALLWFIAAVLIQSVKVMGKSAHKREISCLFCASIVFLLHNLIDFSFYLPEVSFIWCAILGLLYSFSRDSLPES